MVVHRPSGTVTFLFTDIEGSTRRWEADPDEMRSALAAHDAALRAAVEAHGGWVFKHTGDGVCAAFSVADAAMAAAIEAQRRLGLPVRMGIATGSAELRGDDYFGPALNRAARVMAAGHGGQVLVAAATAALLPAAALLDLGVYRLRDLSGVEHLYQVRADGLSATFPPLRTMDTVPGNLPLQSTSFVGREVELKEVIDAVRSRRLVTLTGVGGVGKTRLAVQAAAELTGEFPDGVWVVELAPVGDPGAVPDAVAGALGVTLETGRSFAATLGQALSGRSLLIVLDNCEHVLDAAAAVVDAILAGGSAVRVLATSREGLGLPAEQLWPVRSLDVRAGVDSVAVELFLERARAVNPGFVLQGEPDAAAVIEICARLDGIPLAIELAAARMVAMSPRDVRARLGDRFRLLGGSRRGLERHQTLRQAVGWSYDLLDVDERLLLTHCAVFAGGFDAAAVTAILDEVDDYTALDGLESLVRKSLVTVDHRNGATRYGLLETIRQYAEELLAASGTIAFVRDRHAAYYADRAIDQWQRWDGPEQRATLDWVELEFDNLRAGYQWATDRNDLDTAAAIAAHATMLAFGLQRYEPVSWAEALLPAATAADIAQLPRLYTAASHCSYTLRPDDGVRYAHRAVELEHDPRYQPFEHGWGRYWEGTANAFAGRADTAVDLYAALAELDDPSAHVQGRCGQTFLLPLLRRVDEAVALAEDTVSSALAHGNPWLIAHAFNAAGYAHEPNDPGRALGFFHRALTYSLEHGSPFFEAQSARQAARLEALHGDPDRALALYARVIDSYQQAGNTVALAGTIHDVARTLLHLGHPDTSAVLLGAARQHPVPTADDTLEQLRTILGDTTCDRLLAEGEAMHLADAARHARHHIDALRNEGPARDPQPTPGPTP